MRDDDDLVAAPVTPLVLTILAEGESYGFAILDRVRQAEGRELAWSDAMVYPLLHRLRRLGYLSAEWRVGADDRRRRYYAITDAGRTQLARAEPASAGGHRSPGRPERGSRWRFATPIGPIACLAA